MQEIRARVAALSGLTGQLIDGILREYYRFSPEIAANLEHDDAARGTVLSLVVRPLMAWFNLAVTLGLNPSDAKTIEQHVRDVLDQRQGAHGRLSGARILEAIRAGKPLPGLVPPAIRPFAEKAREAARLPLASWALLEPLARIWSLDTGHTHVIDAVSHWLAAAPLETLAQPAGADDLHRELTTLAGFFDFCPLARRQVGIRLAAAWPEAVPALEKHGFVG
jgi:hypothetical protein